MLVGEDRCAHLAASAPCTVPKRTAAGHTEAPAAPSSWPSSSLHFPKALAVLNSHITPEEERLCPRKPQPPSARQRPLKSKCDPFPLSLVPDRLAAKVESVLRGGSCCGSLGWILTAARSGLSGMNHYSSVIGAQRAANQSRERLIPGHWFTGPQNRFKESCKTIWEMRSETDNCSLLSIFPAKSSETGYNCKQQYLCTRQEMACYHTSFRKRFIEQREGTV